MVSCSLWSLCGNDANGEWVTTAEVTTDDGWQGDGELMLCGRCAHALGLDTTPREEDTP